MQVVIEGGVGATPETLVRQAQVKDEFYRSHNVRQLSRQLEVSKPLTPAADVSLFRTTEVKTRQHNRGEDNSHTGDSKNYKIKKSEKTIS